MGQITVKTDNGPLIVQIDGDSPTPEDVRKIKEFVASQQQPVQPPPAPEFKEQEGLPIAQEDVPLQRLGLDPSEVMEAPKAETSSAEYWNRYFAPDRIPNESEMDYASRNEEARKKALEASSYMTGQTNSAVESPEQDWFGGRQGEWLKTASGESKFDNADDLAKYLVEKGATDLIFAESNPTTKMWMNNSRKVEKVRAQQRVEQYQQYSDEASGIVGVLINPERKVEAGTLVKSLISEGAVNPYLLQDIAVAQETGELDSYRSFERSMDVPEGYANMATYTLEGIGSLLLGTHDYLKGEDFSFVDKDGKMKVDIEQFQTGAEGLMERFGVTQDQADLIMINAVSIPKAITGISGEYAADLLTAGFIRKGFAKGALRDFNKYLAKNAGGAKTLEEAAKKGYDPTVIMNGYFSSVGSTAFPRLNSWLRTTRAESLDIASRSSTASKSLKQSNVQAADDAIKKAQDDLDKIPSDDVRKLNRARNNLLRAQNKKLRLQSENSLPSYFGQLAREYAPSVIGAASVNLIAENAGVTDPLVRELTTAGGALAASLAPNLVTKGTQSFLLAPVIVIQAAAQAITAGSGSGKPNLSNTKRAAEQWISKLGDLDPEAYDEVMAMVDAADERAQKMLEMVDPITGQSVFSQTDVDMTLDVLVNIPLLRIYQEAMQQQISVGDLTSVSNDISTALNESLKKETQLLDKMALFANSLSERYGKDFGGNEELKEFYANFTTLHTALDGDFKKRLNALEAEVDLEADDLLLRMQGRKLGPDNESYTLPDVEKAFNDYNVRKRMILELKGLDDEQISQKVLEETTQRLEALTAMTRANRKLNSDLAKSDPSSELNAVFLHINKIKSEQFDIEYEQWRNNAGSDVFMDARFIRDSIIGGSEAIETLASYLQREGRITSAVEVPVKVGLVKGERGSIPAKEINVMETVFGAGAEREYNFISEQISPEVLTVLQKTADIKPADGGYTKWIKLRDALQNIDTETARKLFKTDRELDALDGDELADLNANVEATLEIFRTIGTNMRLPIGPKEMQDISKALGAKADQLSKSKISGLRESGRTLAISRENLFGVAESPELGFKSDFFGVDGGQPMGAEVTGKLRDINTRYNEEVILATRTDDQIRRWTYTATGAKAKQDSSLVEYRNGTGPAFTIDNLKADFAKAETDAQRYELVENVIALAFGGKKDPNDKGFIGDVPWADAEEGLKRPPVFRLDNASPNLESVRNAFANYAKKRLLGSAGFQDFLKNVDIETLDEDGYAYYNAFFNNKKWGDVQPFTDEDMEFLTYLNSIRSYDFDADGNIIAGSGRPLIDLEDLASAVGWDQLRKVNKLAAETDVKAAKLIQDAAATTKVQVNVDFSDDNIAALTAINLTRSLGAKPARGGETMYDSIIQGDMSSEVVEEMRSAHINNVVKKAEIQGKSPAEVADIEARASKAFDYQLRYEVSKYINDKTIQFSDVSDIARDGTEVSRTVEINVKELDNLLGDPDGTDQMRRVAANLKSILGEDHYNDVKTIADFQARKLTTYSRVNITGKAKAMSLESWLSRFYSISRGVVSPRYVLSEALIQRSRIQGQKQFLNVISDPAIASHIAEIVRTGRLPTSEEKIRAFDEAMIAVIAKGTRAVVDEEPKSEEDIQNTPVREGVGSAPPSALTQASGVVDQMTSLFN